MFEFSNDYQTGQSFSVDISRDIRKLWKDEAIPALYASVEDVLIPHSTKLFFNELSRVLDETFIPTNQDILHLRCPTATVSDIKFVIEEKTFHFYDVSGLKPHRKQWIHYFSDVTAILFVVAISSYDQVMFEDSNTNRMHDAVELFEQVINNPLLEKPETLIFFNKRDIFEKKIATVPLKNYFSEYVGKPGNPTQGYEFIKKLFTSKPKVKRPIFTHLTCCTDTKMMSKIIEAMMY